MSGGKPVAGTTDFESMTHEQMLALLKSADHQAVSDVSVKLAAVAKTVNTVGEHLKAHVTGLQWEGEGGDAFREWSNQTANATLKLSDYAQDASKYMGVVAQQIADTHSKMPALSQTTSAQADLHHATKALEQNDSPNPSLEKSAMLANSRIESTRGDAASAMRALATSYVHNGGQINALKPPTFPPPALELGKRWIDPNRHITVSGSQSTNAYVSGSGGYGARHQYSGGGSTSFNEPGGGYATPSDHRTSSDHISSTVPLPHETNAHMEINSTAPPATLPNPSVSAGLPPHSDTSKPSPSGFIPPAFGGPGGNPPRFGDRPGGSLSLRPGGRVPRFGTEFTEGTTSAGTGGSTPRGNGITGGRPVQSPSGRPSARLPRGMVVGGEESSNGQSGRSMVGRGMSGLRTGGEGAAGAGRNGLVGGRRLASEPGGTVGRPVQPGKSGGRPFTQGGSGLVAGREEDTERQPGRSGRSGMVPRGRGRSRRREDERGSNRPDYLTEDEETWQQANPRVVPPVID